MNLKEQTYVCVLAECESMTEASQKLFITQPALSLYISNLEKNLGVKLFNRYGKKFVLTFAGERYVEKAKQMLELKREFDEELTGILEGSIGKIRLGIQIRRGPYVLAKVLSAFAKEYPNIEVVVTESTNNPLLQAIENNDVDFILYSCMNIKSNLEYKVIFEEPMLIALPQGDPLNKKAKFIDGKEYGSIDLRYFKNSKFILPEKHQSLRIMADKALADADVVPKNISVIRNIETAMQMVSEGMGVAFNRAGYLGHMHYQNTINYYTISNGNYYAKFVIAWKEKKNLQLYMKRFIDIVYEICRLV